MIPQLLWNVWEVDTRRWQSGIAIPNQTPIQKSLSKFWVRLAGATEVSRRDKVHIYIPAGSGHGLCLRVCLVTPQLLEVQEPQWPPKTAKTPVSSLKCGMRITPIVVTVPRDLVSIRGLVPIMLGTALCRFESCPFPPSLLCELVFSCSSAISSDRWTLPLWLWEKKRQLPLLHCPAAWKETDKNQQL